jgi:translation initiation factor IF-1
MPGDGSWKVEGLIVGPLAVGAYRARLANGHELVAFVPGRAKRAATQWQPGDKVILSVSAYDLSSGRILFEKTQIRL